VPFNTIAGARKPKAADWLDFLRTCIPYVLGNIGPVHPRDNTALDETRRLHLQAIEALCLLERDFPETELSIFVHEILHVPEFVYRWNAVRNYWCFASERFVGWMKNFIKNRYLSVENMVQFMRCTND
jgi:hypothetical protein